MELSRKGHICIIKSVNKARKLFVGLTKVYILKCTSEKFIPDNFKEPMVTPFYARLAV